MKINKTMILLLIMPILLAGTSLALGVSPGKNILDFQPNMEGDINLIIINNEQKDLSVVLTAEGELSQYITLDESEIHLNPSENSKTVSYKVKFPKSLGRSGLHTTNIVIRELKSVKEGSINVGASLAVISILGINVPYQGKYAEASMTVIESNQGEESVFFVDVTNHGKEVINTAIASIEILENGKHTVTITTNEKSINPGNKRELIARWKADSPGSYQARAKVNYDGKITETQANFNVGGFFIKLLDISVNSFNFGGIAKFNILLENIANKKAKEVFVKMTLNDESRNNIMDIESQRAALKPQERKELQAYWDTANVEKGNYKGKVILHSDDKVWENPINMDVKENSIKTQIGSPTGMIIADTGGIFKQSSIVSVLLIILIAINIGWFFYFKKKKK